MKEMKDGKMELALLTEAVEQVQSLSTFFHAQLN